jgi:hypothetical protein
LTSPSSRSSKRRRHILRGQRRCLFCGVFASDTRLNEQLNELMCEECFDQIGKLLSLRRDTPIYVAVERCMVCKRSARTRLLVSGIAAAICRNCYLASKKARSRVAIDPSIYPPKGTRLRALQRSRAARLRERRQYQRLGQAISSLRPRDRAARGWRLATKQALMKVSMESHLDLVTSREQVRGRPALKSPDGRRPLYPFGSS